MTEYGAFPTAPEDPVGESIKRRVARWEAKYTPERVAAILGAKGEQMRERFRVQTEMLGYVEQRVAEVTDAAGVPVMMRIWYKSFAREMWALSRK